MTAPKDLLFRVLREAAAQEIVRAEREARAEGITFSEYVGRRMTALDMAPAKREYHAQLIWKRISERAK